MKSKMNVIDWEFIAKEGKQSLTYNVDIFNLDQKLEKAKVGEVTSTKSFSLSGFQFNIDIYIGGVDMDSKDHISVFLVDHSPQRTHVKFEVLVETNLEDISETAEEPVFTSKGLGWVKCFPHARCTTRISGWKIRNLYLMFQIQLLDQNPRVRQDVLHRLSTLEEKFSEVQNELQLLKSKFRRDDGSVEAVAASEEEDDAHVLLVKAPSVKCPMCRRVVRKPMRLQQCPKGHIICDSCYHQLNRKPLTSSKNRKLCVICKAKYCGRPVVLEQVLGL